MDDMHARYTAFGKMTDPGRHHAHFDGLPADIGTLAGITQGLIVHEYLTGLYGFEITDEQRATVHTRPVEQILDPLVTGDCRPLAEARPPAERFVGDCRHFTVLLTALLRAQGTPARARCGFGTYFGPDMAEDHWVCEYYDEAAARWVLADAQLDQKQQDLFKIDFDPLDVPRDRFVVAGQAWSQCRKGEADAARFGLSALPEGGDWWIAGNLIRDVAALANMEMLPWDCWGAMPQPHEPIDDERTALFDDLAALTADPGPGLVEKYESDDRLTVPGTVFNAVLRRPEEI